MLLIISTDDIDYDNDDDFRTIKNVLASRLVDLLIRDIYKGLFCPKFPFSSQLNASSHILFQRRGTQSEPNFNIRNGT